MIAPAIALSVLPAILLAPFLLMMALTMPMASIILFVVMTLFEKLKTRLLRWTIG